MLMCIFQCVLGDRLLTNIMDYLKIYDEITKKINSGDGDLELVNRLIDIYESSLVDHEIRDSIPLYVTDRGNSDTINYINKKILESTDDFVKKEFNEWILYIENKLKHGAADGGV